jgi:hypothetical protein
MTFLRTRTILWILGGSSRHRHINNIYWYTTTITKIFPKQYKQAQVQVSDSVQYIKNDVSLLAATPFIRSYSTRLHKIETTIADEVGSSRSVASSAKVVVHFLLIVVSTCPCKDRLDLPTKVPPLIWIERR